MTTLRPGDDLLHGLLRGVLEPGDALALRDRLATDTTLGLRFHRLQLQHHGVAPFSLRPGAALQLRRATALDDQAPGAGDRIVLRVRGPLDHWPLVLVDGEALAPVDVDERTPLGAFRQVEGTSELDLVLPGHLGEDWVLALVPWDFEVPWHEPEPRRWQGVLEAALEGRLPAWRFLLTEPRAP